MKHLKKFNFFLLLLFIFCLFFSTKSFAMKYYENVGTTTGLVTATSLNVRQGPGTNFSSVTRVYKNEYIRIFAKIGDWYVIQTNSDYIGCANKNYIKLIYPNSNNVSNTNTSNNTSSNNTNQNIITSSLNSNEQEVFNLINKQRTNNGLSNLKIDSEVQRVARIKAQDMVNNNYFDHNSPTYGTPFEMLKSFGISYKSAGENIAGNSSNSGAVNAWMNSSGHRANILNENYNYTGIGIVNSPKYGYIYVQQFIQK